MGSTALSALFAGVLSGILFIWPPVSFEPSFWASGLGFLSSCQNGHTHMKRVMELGLAIGLINIVLTLVAMGSAWKNGVLCVFDCISLNLYASMTYL